MKDKAYVLSYRPDAKLEKRNHAVFGQFYTVVDNGQDMTISSANRQYGAKGAWRMAQYFLMRLPVSQRTRLSLKSNMTDAEWRQHENRNVEAEATRDAQRNERM